mmetsp:Transcript_65350/g.136898  ORF Transcript_65350/g.136898 Transcript_65350/m.136898 type:complete len:181 (+) Transcript_65350:798-1340(+)
MASIVQDTESEIHCKEKLPVFSYGFIGEVEQVRACLNNILLILFAGMQQSSNIHPDSNNDNFFVATESFTGMLQSLSILLDGGQGDLSVVAKARAAVLKEVREMRQKREGSWLVAAQLFAGDSIILQLLLDGRPMTPSIWIFEISHQPAKFLPFLLEGPRFESSLNWLLMKRLRPNFPRT